MSIHVTDFEKWCESKWIYVPIFKLHECVEKGRTIDFRNTIGAYMIEIYREILQFETLFFFNSDKILYNMGIYVKMKIDR